MNVKLTGSDFSKHS